MADALSMIPEGEQYNNLRRLMKQMKEIFPDNYANMARKMERWIAEIDSGTGRNHDQLRDDILDSIGAKAIAKALGIQESTAEKIILGKNDGGMNLGEALKLPKVIAYLKANPPGTSETVEGPPPEEATDDEGIGENEEEGDEDLTILTGKEVKWHFDKTTGKWYVEYGLPGSDRALIFEASPDQMDALFGEGMRPREYDETTFKNLVAQDLITYAGNVSEMEGTGSFEGEVERVQAIALDEGRLPEWAKQDPAVMDALYIAQAEGKSDEWLLEQISKTEGFQQRFPDIKAFQSEGNLTLQEAITGFLEMEAGVNSAIKAAGLDSATVTPEVIGGLLKAGHSLDVINKTASSFKRMTDNKAALDAFNQILESEGLDTISTLDEMLEFVEGRASAEVYDIWEASSLQESAAAAGLGDLFTAEDAMEAALSGNHTLESATAAMQQAAKLLLRMRHEVDTGKFGLDHEELIDISLGQAPRSGRQTAEIHDSINRAVAQAQGELKKRTQAFKAFDNAGTPQATSLRKARQES